MKEAPEQRSRTMRAVKSADTSPEIRVRRLVHRMGYRFRLHRADLPGKPDLAFPGLRKVVFVHGCFWHGHDCARGARVPRQNRSYWLKKIGGNRARDKRTLANLRASGWSTAVVWECSLRNEGMVAAQLSRFLSRTQGIQEASRRNLRAAKIKGEPTWPNQGSQSGARAE